VGFDFLFFNRSKWNIAIMDFSNSSSSMVFVGDGCLAILDAVMDFGARCQALGFADSRNSVTIYSASCPLRTSAGRRQPFAGVPSNQSVAGVAIGLIMEPDGI